MPDVGDYTLPVILSFQGIDAAVNKELGDKLKPAAKKAGEDYAKTWPKASTGTSSVKPRGSEFSAGLRIVLARSFGTFSYTAAMHALGCCIINPGDIARKRSR
jgi:hypothetical protein